MSGVKREAEDTAAGGQSQQPHLDSQDNHAEKAEAPVNKRVRLDDGSGQPSSPQSEGVDAAPSSPTNSLVKSKNDRNNAGHRGGRGGRGARGGGRGARGGDKQRHKGKQRDWGNDRKSNGKGGDGQAEDGIDAQRDEDAGPRIPKKKVAMLIGYSGLGYSGSQV